MADFADFFDTECVKNTLYTRPYQLPVNVAFKIEDWQQTVSKYTKQTTNRVIVVLDNFVSLQIFPGSKYDKFSKEKMDALNAAIKSGHQWYLVARHWTAEDRVPIDVICEEKRKDQDLPVFDSNIHSIQKIEKSSAGGSDDGPSPKKKKFN